MEYKIKEEQMISGYETNNLEKIKESISALIELDSEEKVALSSIQTLEELNVLIEQPEKYLKKAHTEEFMELIELIDLMGGIYFA